MALGRGSTTSASISIVSSLPAGVSFSSRESIPGRGVVGPPRFRGYRFLRKTRQFSHRRQTARPRTEPATRCERIARVQIRAELTGNLWKVVVTEGQSVAQDETIMILESMKMEIPITAPRPGKISRLLAKEGETVQAGQVLAELE